MDKSAAPMSEQAEARVIAGKLNEAQRRELCRYDPVAEAVAFIRLYTIKRRCRCRLPEAFALVPKLAVPRTDRCRTAQITPLGLAVRQALTNGETDA